MSAIGQFNITRLLCRLVGSGRSPFFTERLPGGRIWLAWCCLALSLQLLPAATLVHSPYLQSLQKDHVTIVWSARENLSGTVRYSTDTGFSQSSTATVRVFLPSQTGGTLPTFYQYRAELTGLTEGTSYSYKVFIGGEDVTRETDYRFRTPGSGPFSFLVFGDSGDGSFRQNAVLLAMNKEQPNFVIHVGDIAYENGTFDEFTNNYFSSYATLMRRACFFAIAGNHEYYSDAVAYLALNAPPTETVPAPDFGRYYSFDWGDVHFAGLDANLLDAGHAAAGGRMLAWLENDMATTRALWKVAFFHQTPYATLHHADDPIDIAAQQLLVPILERHGVQLVLAGHEHNYQRSKPMRGGIPVSGEAGTVYMTSGGGGGVLHDISLPKPSFLEQQASVIHYLRVDVDGAQVTIHTVGAPDGKVFSEIDRVQLTALPVLAQGDAVVNGASFQPSVASGSLVSIFGQGLALGTSTATGFPLPLSLSGAAVTLNGKPVSMTFASPTQINAALPLEALGPATLRVTTSLGFAETQINISDTAPAIFPFAITHANGTLVSASSPGSPGERLVIYMTGLGQVDGRLDSGQAAPSVPLLRVVAPVQVQIGDTIQVTPDFAGLTPGYFGVYQVNIMVPQNLPTKTYPLRVSVKGNPSNFQNLQVQARTP